MEPRARRSLLFVPGDDARKLARADLAGADTLILDLEDAVAPDRKRCARSEVSARIRDGAFTVSEVAVRVNAPGTEYFEADLHAVVAAGTRLLVIPKSESAVGIAAVAEAVMRLEPSAPVRLLALVETAQGIVDVASIAKGAGELDGLCFGNADFCLDMGLPDGDLSSGVVYQARCNLAIAAAAARVSAIDGVCLAAKDEVAFRREASDAAGLGYHGKLCIHPSQVPIANAVFTPTEVQVASARRIVAAWEVASACGQGVFSLDGKMIDAPLVAIQRRILERARCAGVLPEMGAV